jgi:hypothetical protein
VSRRKHYIATPAHAGIQRLQKNWIPDRARCAGLSGMTKIFSGRDARCRRNANASAVFGAIRHAIPYPDVISAKARIHVDLRLFAEKQNGCPISRE